MCECHEEHAEIQKAIDHIDATLEYHTAEVHGTLMERHEIEKVNEQFISALLGPRRTTGLHAGSPDARVLRVAALPIVR